MKKTVKNLTLLITTLCISILLIAAHATADTKNTDKKSEEEKEVSITISAAGDCTFGSDRSSPSSANFYSVYKKVKSQNYFFKRVKKVFAKDDLTIVNFEGTLTKSTTRSPKRFAFRGNPSYVNILKKANIEAVSFANNHCRDYGNKSYSDTIKTLKKAGIKYASYSKVSIYSTKGKKIGMIAVNGLEGTTYSKSLIKNGIKRLKKKKVDLIIVSMHAGIERTNTPNTSQKDIARYAVRLGANLVLGHHPHVLQGIEKYRDAYIVYSLGNFCFGGNTNPADKDTMIFQQTFTFKGNKLLKKKSKASIIPCSISSTPTRNNYQPKISSGARYKRILNRISKYSKPFGVSLKKKNGKLTGELK